MKSFQRQLKAFLKKHPGKIRKLADKVQVSKSSIDRWARGMVYPNSLLREAILEAIKKLED